MLPPVGIDHSPDYRRGPPILLWHPPISVASPTVAAGFSRHIVFTMYLDIVKTKVYHKSYISRKAKRLRI